MFFEKDENFIEKGEERRWDLEEWLKFIRECFVEIYGVEGIGCDELWREG